MHRQSGFTLTELAVVVVIVAMLIGGMLIPLSMQDELRRVHESQKRLDDARDALLGFAAANGRLPCPASPTSSGLESYCNATSTGACATADQVAEYRSHGNCSHFYAGFLPAATLGLSAIDTQGYAVDSWGNRIRYAVSRAPDSAVLTSNFGDPPANTLDQSFTRIDGMRTEGMSDLHPDLQVCAAAPINNSQQCATGVPLANNAVAVIFSTGRNHGTTGGAGLDEAANLANHRAFVSHPPAPATAATGEFDDLVVWLSPNILYNRMIAAGRLP